MTRSKGLSDNFAKKRRAARRLRYQQQLLNQDEELPGPSYQNILPHEDNQDNRFTQSDSDSTSDEGMFNGQYLTPNVVFKEVL